MTHYTSFDYPTKKAVKADVRRRNEILAAANGNADNVPDENRVEFAHLSLRLVVRVATPFGFSYVPNGKVFPCGPHYPRPHAWYAEGQVKDGILISVK